jgi:dolichol-phosphate mannosyltransferase
MTPVPAGDEPDDLTGLLRRPVLPHPRTPPDREPGAYAGASGGRHLAPVPQVCVVVPTRNEERNVEPLLRRLEAALRGVAAEVIFVDDSDDTTPAAIDRASQAMTLPVRVHHRPPGERQGGLGGAVSEGFVLCSAPYAVIIDGDLQHPPETIPTLLATALREDADVVVASRYVTGGSSSGLSGTTRQLVSSTSNLMCRLAFPRRLRAVTDVMSGFFLVRVAAVDRRGLRPDGYKILLELLATAGPLRVREVGYVFAARHAGDSNASVGEGIRFARRLFALRVPRAVRFALVGASGTLPNLLGTAVLHRLDLHYLAAAIIATQVAIAWNFAGCELLVWERQAGSWRRRYPPFAVVNNLDLVIRLPLLALLVGRWGLGVGVATLLSLAAAVLARYLVVDRLIYRHRVPGDTPAPAPATATHGSSGPSGPVLTLPWSPATAAGEEAPDVAT